MLSNATFAFSKLVSISSSLLIGSFLKSQGNLHLDLLGKRPESYDSWCAKRMWWRLRPQNSYIFRKRHGESSFWCCVEDIFLRTTISLRKISKWHRNNSPTPSQNFNNKPFIRSTSSSMSYLKNYEISLGLLGAGMTTRGRTFSSWTRIVGEVEN